MKMQQGDPNIFVPQQFINPVPHDPSSSNRPGNPATGQRPDWYFSTPLFKEGY